MNENSIIQLSPAAAGHIASIIKRHQNSMGFRLSVKKTGCSGYMYAPSVVSEVNENDIRIDTPEGLSVFVDPEWLSILQGIQIDLVEESLGQKKLVYTNPNVDEECGCGESFSLEKKAHDE